MVFHIYLSFKTFITSIDKKKIHPTSQQNMKYEPSFKNCKMVTMLTLQAMGGFPPPEISWWIGTRRLKPEQMVGHLAKISRGAG